MLQMSVYRCHLMNIEHSKILFRIHLRPQVIVKADRDLSLILANQTDLTPPVSGKGEAGLCPCPLSVTPPRVECLTSGS